MTLEDLGLDPLLIGQFFAAGWGCVMLHFVWGFVFSCIKQAIKQVS